jgi:hypothetical protein
MDTLAILGFALVLGAWFLMFFRVRRDFPDRGVSRYGSYTGPRVFGFRVGGRSAFSLVTFYWQHYGLDARISLGVLGVLLIVIAAIRWAPE